MGALTQTFYQLLGDNLPGRAGMAAIVDGDRVASFADVVSDCDSMADYLLRQGIMPGDRVIVHLRKSCAEVAAMFAIAKVGAVIVNVNPQWTADQLRYVADDCRARILITEPRAAANLEKKGLPASTERMLVVGAAPLSMLGDSWDGAAPVAPLAEVARLDTELAMIIYTSGSTGGPKGVMLSHRNIVTGARSVARYLGLGADDRLLSVLPYSFDYGLNQLTTMMLLGGTVVHQPVPLPAEIVRTMRDHDVTGLAAVPPLWSQIARLLDQSPMHFPALRRITNSGGKIPLNILERLETVFPQADIYLMYGLTEAFRSTYLPPALFRQKMGAIGRAIPGAEVYVIQAGKGLAGPGEQGELVHRGPLISMGYWERPEQTRQCIRPCPELAGLIGDEPVLYSGDTVSIDDDGDIWFVGRTDAMIKTSGFRVSPDEVEDLMSRGGQLSDVVAFGVEDADLGQVVHVAAVPLYPIDEAALVTYCRGVMPHYMVPRKIHLWGAPMPRTASGKLNRPDVIRACRAGGFPAMVDADEAAPPIQSHG